MELICFTCLSSPRFGSGTQFTPWVMARLTEQSVMRTRRRMMGRNKSLGCVSVCVKTQYASIWCFNFLFQNEVSPPNLVTLKQNSTTKINPLPQKAQREENKTKLYIFSSNRQCLVWLRIMFWGGKMNVSKKSFIFLLVLNTDVFSWVLVQQTYQNNQLFTQTHLEK